MDDLTIINKCLSGDPDAFRHIVERHKDRVAGVIYSVTGNRSEVDDLAQEVFIKAYGSLRSFQFDSAFQTWLIRIAVNHSIDYIRRKKIVRFLSLDNLRTFFTRTAESESSDELPLRIERADIRKQVRRAVAKLKPEYRIALVLREFEEFSYREIAETLGISTAAVKSRLFRAREELKNILKPMIEQEQL